VRLVPGSTETPIVSVAPGRRRFFFMPATVAEIGLRAGRPSFGSGTPPASPSGERLEFSRTRVLARSSRLRSRCHLRSCSRLCSRCHLRSCSRLRSRCRLRWWLHHCRVPLRHPLRLLFHRVARNVQPPGRRASQRACTGDRTCKWAADPSHPHHWRIRLRNARPFPLRPCSPEARAANEAQGRSEIAPGRAKRYVSAVMAAMPSDPRSRSSEKEQSTKSNVEATKRRIADAFARVRRRHRALLDRLAKR
jgi:hypothetical protein